MTRTEFRLSRRGTVLGGLRARLPTHDDGAARGRVGEHQADAHTSRTGWSPGGGVTPANYYTAASVAIIVAALGDRRPFPSPSPATASVASCGASTHPRSPHRPSSARAHGRADDVRGRHDRDGYRRPARLPRMLPQEVGSESSIALPVRTVAFGAIGAAARDGDPNQSVGPGHRPVAVLRALAHLGYRDARAVPPPDSATPAACCRSPTGHRRAEPVVRGRLERHRPRGPRRLRSRRRLPAPALPVELSETRARAARPPRRQTWPARSTPMGSGVQPGFAPALSRLSRSRARTSGWSGSKTLAWAGQLSRQAPGKRSRCPDIGAFDPADPGRSALMPPRRLALCCLSGRRSHWASPSCVTGTRAWAAAGLSIARSETPSP